MTLYPCRLRIDPPADGAWNMAVDEALLEHVAAGDAEVWLRFYEWREPTLSLGYFQSCDEWRDHVEGECTVVRRQTGGGAILHDRELTYSLVLPPRHPLAGSAQDLYLRVHEALLAALRRLAIETETWTGQQANNEAFLCFLRRGPGDVVIRPPVPGQRQTADRTAFDKSARSPHYKICGSAQRRRRGALLLHGSLLLSTSPHAPQIAGLEQVTGSSLSPADARRAWLDELAHLLGEGTTRPVELPERVHNAASRLAVEKYSTCQWTARR